MLWGAALGNQVSGASTPALNSVLFAVEFPRLGISVFSASGQRRFTLKPVPAAMPSDDRETETYLHAYFAPSVDPDNRLLVYVDCSGLVLRGNFSQSFQACLLVQRDLESGVVKTILDPGPGLFPDSPSWSDDGSSIAILLGTDVVTLASVTGTITARMRAVMVRPTSPAWGGERDYVRYGEDGHTVLLNLSDDCQATEHPWTCPVFGLVDLQQQTIHRLDTEFGELNLSRGLYLPTRARFDDNGNKVEQPTSPPRAANLDRLLGDFDHPVYAPVFSPDRRYFFYLTFKEGWFSKKWIEGYDRQSHRTFHITTVHRALYSE